MDAITMARGRVAEAKGRCNLSILLADIVAGTMYVAYDRLRSHPMPKNPRVMEPSDVTRKTITAVSPIPDGVLAARVSVLPANRCDPHPLFQVDPVALPIFSAFN